jgi:uncharacterized membrane protein
MEIPAAPPPHQRLDSLDLLRGLAMVVMAIDHARDFFSNANFLFNPGDLTHTTVGFFLTRGVTNFCAPVFMFLCGTGVFLSASHGKPLGEVQRTLIIRGLWLIFLEFTLIRFGWYFNLDYHFVKLGVIWAIGWSMIALAGLLYLPRWLVTTVGCAMIGLHNLLDGITPQSLGALGWLWNILHVPGLLTPYPGWHFQVKYPLIPWIGVMAAGYGFGACLLWDAGKRKKFLIYLGLGLTLAFFLLRLSNFYGDPHPWTFQKNALFTCFSFLDCAKYPPSLLYLLIALGPAFLALAWFERLSGPLVQSLVIFGRVPFIYYVLHLPLLHGMAVAVDLVRYGEAPWLFANPPEQLWPIDYTYDLVATYLAWGAAVLLLYPVCRWFADLKARRRDWWWLYYL